MSEDLPVFKKQRTELSLLLQSSKMSESHNTDNSYSPTEDLPEPPGVAEFLQDPTLYHPNEDFVNNTFMEVSVSLAVV